MQEVLDDLSTESLATAVKANLNAFFQYFRFSSEANVSEDAQRFRWYTGIAHPWFNGVLSLQAPSEDAPQRVLAEIDYFRSMGASSFSWWLDPHLDLSQWSAQLLPHGFQFSDDTPGMAIDMKTLPKLPPSKLSIQAVNDSSALATWTDVFIRGYGLPESFKPIYLDLMSSLGTELPVRNYLGWLDDRPVGASSLFIGAGVAGVYNVATVQEARGQGVGTALSLVPLHEARELGYRVGVLQSSQMGYRVYERIGFREVCRMDYFAYSVTQ
jgi:GNAT superfamily N-acetyltransferase